MPFHPNIHIYSFKLEDSVLEIVLIERLNVAYSSDPTKPIPSRAWKEIYGVVGGEIKKIRTIEGVHIPAQLSPEKVEFPNEKPDK